MLGLWRDSHELVLAQIRDILRDLEPRVDRNLCELDCARHRVRGRVPGVEAPVVNPDEAPEAQEHAHV